MNRRELANVALGGAADGQRLARLEHARDRLTQLAPGGEHQDHPVPGRGRPGESARRADRLVVGMRVEGDDGAHDATVRSCAPTISTATQPK